MLSSMRNNRKILSVVLWAVIIAFVSTIFVVWGIGGRENRASFVAKVGDSTIGYDEYRNFYDNTVKQLRAVFGNAYDEYAKSQDIDALVISELINRRLFLAEAIRLGIPASDYEVIETIKNISAFHDDKGQFDSERYVQALNYNRQTPAVFEASVRDDILIGKLQSLIRDGQSAVSDAAIMNEYNYRGKMAQVSYFSVPISTFPLKDAPSADALSSYYERNKNSYRVPAKIKLKYISFDENAFQPGDISIDNKEIEGYYAERISSYTVPESVVVRNIAVSVSDWNDEKIVQAAKAKIDEALSFLKKPGADFVAAVKKYSDPSASANDGLVGRVYKGQLKPDFEEAIFVAKQGEVTDVLKTDFGYHIVKIEEKTPGKVYTLDEKRDEITEAIKNNKQKTAFRNHVLSVYKDILKAGNITAYSEASSNGNLKVLSTPLFAENEPTLPVFLSKPDALRNMFSLSKTELGQLIEDGAVTYLFEVEDKIPFKIPALDEVKEQVTEAYKKEESAKAGLAGVEKALAEQGFDKTAASFKAVVSKSGEFQRSEPDDAFLGEQVLINAIFASKQGETLKNAYLIGDKVYAIKVERIILPSTDAFENEKEAIASYIRSVKAEEAIVSYIDTLKSKVKIEINPAFLNSGKTN